MAGLKKNCMAAHANGLTKVIVSVENQKDILEVPKSVLKQLEILYAEDMSEVLDYALV